MKKFIGIRIDENDYDLISRMAKVSGKSFSDFVREVLHNAIRQEMRETSLLERLVRMIENLQNFSGNNTCKFNDEILREIYKLLLYTVMHDRAVFDLLFVLPEKRKEYLQRRKELEEKFGIGYSDA